MEVAGRLVIQGKFVLLVYASFYVRLNKLDAGVLAARLAKYVVRAMSVAILKQIANTVDVRLQTLELTAVKVDLFVFLVFAKLFVLAVKQNAAEHASLCKRIIKTVGSVEQFVL